jgi:hypothetical protein
MVITPDNHIGDVPIEYDTADTVQDSLDPREKTVDGHGDAWLILVSDDDSDEFVLSDVDDNEAKVRFFGEMDDEGIHHNDMVFESFSMARLAWGLWKTCGPFAQPESGKHIPISVAVEGQAAIAAYLRVNNGYPRPVKAVADRMDVTEGTVANYCHRMRWKPGGSDD